MPQLPTFGTRLVSFLYPSGARYISVKGIPWRLIFNTNYRLEILCLEKSRSRTYLSTFELTKIPRLYFTPEKSMSTGLFGRHWPLINESVPLNDLSCDEQVFQDFLVTYPTFSQVPDRIIGPVYQPGCPQLVYLDKPESVGPALLTCVSDAKETKVRFVPTKLTYGILQGDYWNKREFFIQGLDLSQNAFRSIPMRTIHQWIDLKTEVKSEAWSSFANNY